MSIVISYSHEDKDFVDELGANLFKNQVHVWMDRWELKVGDSLTRKIQDAIQGADAMIVVLSNTSVESEWCKRELTAGLVRELEEKRVVVLPAIIDDCAIPLFLKDKIYADFRKDKDEALRQLLEATAKFTSNTLYRSTSSKINRDYGLYYSLNANSVEINLTFLDMPTDQPISVITEIMIKGNRTTAQRYRKFLEHGFDWFQRSVTLAMISDYVEQEKIGFLLLEDSNPKNYQFKVGDPKRDIVFEIKVIARRLGEDTGKDIAVNWGIPLKEYVERLKHERDRLTPAANAKLLALIQSMA
jgi:hypothetical protein